MLYVNEAGFNSFSLYGVSEINRHLVGDLVNKYVFNLQTIDGK